MRRDRLFLQDIVGASASIKVFLEGVTEQQFLASDLIQSAVLQKLLIIGEAAARLSDEMREQYSEVDWSGIIGFRNVAIHGYFTLDWSIIWTTATDEVPALTRSIQAILDT